MHFVPQSPQQSKNLLLSMLPDADFQGLRPHLEYIETPLHFLLFERDKPIRYVYFPLSGEHSILSVMENGAAVEVGTVGYEGLSTVDLLMGSDIATETTVCQIPGASLRAPATVFKELISGDTPLRRISMKYLQAYLSLVSQSAACNALHNIEQRFARWVLMSHDRARGEDFRLTQEYIATMLGVHRPSVSLVAGTFQRVGLIQYNRGVIKVINREELEAACCECYDVVRKQFKRFLNIDLA